eukprot:scaffold228113_cov19-Tisochrysis_lutea.AAC.1
MMVDTPGPAKRKNIRKANARKQVQPLENMLSYPCTGLLHMHALPVCMQVECAFNQIWLLGSLPPPFGAAAAESCSDLQVWHDAFEQRQLQEQQPQQRCCQWADIPSSCDPLHLLDNEANNFQ